MNEFKSGFAEKLNLSLEWREARGYKRESHLHAMMKFDRYCSQQYPSISELSHDIVHDWLEYEADLHRGLIASVIMIREFGKYLCSIDENAYILPKKYAPSPTRSNPYIFSDNELTLLFNEIDLLTPIMSEPYLHEVIPTLLRLIYTCGLRPKEGRELLCDNVNLKTGEILLTHTKRNKERIVVMSDEMLALARDYDLRRVIIANENPYFFPSKSGGAFTESQLYAIFNMAWTNISPNRNNPTARRVRVYDLRHRFASACLNRWLDNGENLMNMLPYLRAYMGHKSLEETAYYIHILPENLLKSPGIDWSVFNSMFPEVKK